MREIKNCTVLRRAGQDCTGGGITARYENVTVIVDVPYLMTEWRGNQYFDRPDEKAVRRHCQENGIDEKEVLILCDKQNNPVYTPYLKPLDAVWGVRNGEKLVGPCAGGNYVIVHGKSYSDDSVICRVHDRYDTEEAWDALSR